MNTTIIPVARVIVTATTAHNSASRTRNICGSKVELLGAVLDAIDALGRQVEGTATNVTIAAFDCDGERMGAGFRAEMQDSDDDDTLRDIIRWARAIKA